VKGSIRAGVLTVSDRCSRGEATDESGPALAALLRNRLNAELVDHACVPDDVEQIAAVFRRWSEPRLAIDLAVSTGGTGLSPRDVTPEAAERVLERRHPGLMELARMRCYAKTPRAFLSRGVAGTINRTLVLTLPGSRRGATEMLEALLDVLPHAIETLRGEAEHYGGPGGSRPAVAAAVAEQSATEAIQPIVLVGGQSRRFGRDKLREPWEGGWLVDRPIAALAAVFGPRVAAVGQCDPAVSRRAHMVIDDRRPGAGPIGGIISALEQVEGGVFVLAGDLPRVSPEAVRRVLSASLESPGAWAVLAGRPLSPEPCFGLYRKSALAALAAALEAGAHRLGEALPCERVRLVELPRAWTTNANRWEDLQGG
jgi:molybdenum cofactor synthesis domain-containing protein